MPKPTKSDAPSSATPEEQEIRERIKGLTSRALQQGRVDPDAVKDIVRTAIGAAPDTGAAAAEARELLVDAVRKLDEALMKSANAAHDALQQLAARGKDFTDNDLKQALASLRELEHGYTAAAGRIGEAMTGKLRSEMMEITAHAQNIGAEASARVAGMMAELADDIGAALGMAKIRDAGARMALLASGVLGGVADALREQSETKKTSSVPGGVADALREQSEIKKKSP